MQNRAHNPLVCSRNCIQPASITCNLVPALAVDTIIAYSLPLHCRMLKRKVHFHTVMVVIITLVVWLLRIPAVFVHVSDLYGRRSDPAKAAVGRRAGSVEPLNNRGGKGKYNRFSGEHTRKKRELMFPLSPAFAVVHKLANVTKF